MEVEIFVASPIREIAESTGGENGEKREEIKEDIARR
jgi:hypothetical protein